MNTKCSACGEKGHWQRDPECKKKSTATAHMTYVEEEANSEYILPFDSECHGCPNNDSPTLACMTTEDDFIPVNAETAVSGETK